MLGRGGVRVDPAADVSELAAVVRAQADRLGFDSPIRAATLAKKRLRELRVTERVQGSGIAAYHRTRYAKATSPPTRDSPTVNSSSSSSAVPRSPRVSP